MQKKCHVAIYSGHLYKMFKMFFFYLFIYSFVWKKTQIKRFYYRNVTHFRFAVLLMFVSVHVWSIPKCNSFIYIAKMRNKRNVSCFLTLLGKQRTGVAILNSTHYCSKTGTE